MKKYFILIFFSLCSLFGKTQTCEEMMEFVKTKANGTTYTSYNSEAISKVTFYQLTIDYKTHYFAIVCFKQRYSYRCNEYIYQVGSNTRINYAMNYLKSAGQAFWEYIHPYRKSLGCAPELDK